MFRDSQNPGSIQKFLSLVVFLEYFHPYFRRQSGFGPLRSKSVSGYGPPFADLDPLPNFPFKHRLYHIW